ncbi:hypothetical protein V6N13_107978 [Hibiscus sabdariffa]
MSLPLVLSGNSADPRLPKRQRQRDEDPPDVPVSTNGNPASGMECDSPAAARTIVSYNDIVTSSGETPQDSEIFDLDDADIDLLEEDVAIGSMNDSDPPTSGHPDASPPVPTSTSPTPAEDFGSQSISPITNPIFVESDNLRDSLPESREPAINPSPLVNDRPVTQETNMAVDSVSPVIAPAPPANLGHVTKDVTQSHATTKPPTHGSHVTLLQQASSSSKPPRVISHQASKPVVSLDPSKHHAIHIPDGDNPRLPMEATTGNISRQNHEDMAE